MTKFTKITAAIVAAAAVLSFAGCSNNTSSASESSSDASVASTAEAANTAEASTADTASTADAASSAEAAEGDTASSAEASTAEAPAFDVTQMFGEWVLAGVNDGTNTMNVADYAASLNADVESCMAYVVIDETTYSSKVLDNESTFTYTVNDNGITVDMDGVELPVVYDADADIIAYAVSQDEVTYKYIFMRNTDDASTAEAETAQAPATAETAE